MATFEDRKKGYEAKYLKDIYQSVISASKKIEGNEL